MALTTENITISAVKNAIGHPNYNLTAIVTDAKTGGTGGKAFDATTNYLIAGALPYWNIYAYNIPAEWVIDEGVLKLKRRYADGGFVSRLGDFRGYRHDSGTPIGYVPSNLSCISGTLIFGAEVSLYGWHMPSSVTHIKVKAGVGGSTQYELLSVATLNSVWTATVDFTFTGVSTSVTTGYIQLYCSNADGDELANITNSMCGDDLYPVTFTFTHSTASATLARAITPYTSVDIDFTACQIFNPAGTGNIKIATGQTTLSAIGVRVTAESADVTEFSFKLYFSQTGASPIYVNNARYTCYASAEGYKNDFYLPTITLHHAAQTGEAMSFYIDDLQYVL